MDPFINETSSYIRDYDIIPTYIKDSARYISLRTGRSLDECIEFVKKEIAPGGRFELNKPEALVLEKNSEGDRIAKSIPIDKYLEGVVQSKEILSPTLAAYTNPEIKESLLAQYIKGNLDRRKKAKKEKFEATMNDDKTLAAVKEAEQSTFKIKNNSLSGAHCSPYTVLWNKSAHSTLTSTCRTVTSYGNANNEKFLYGNRHYWCPDIVKANIISIINNTDLDRVDDVLEKYNLVYPDVEQTMQVIHRSTNTYWRSKLETSSIRALVENLSSVERACFVYTDDFYHLAMFNPVFVRSLLDKLSTKVDSPLDENQIKTILTNMDDSLRAYVSIVCSKELDGKTINDLDKTSKELRIILSTALNIQNILIEITDLIKTLWITKNLPTSIFNVPSIIRRGAITSDTDSTIFTVGYWTQWFVGKLDFSEKSNAIAATMVFLASKLIPHILATVSGNMGVIQKDVRRLSMKNEYSFPVFVLTSKAKHYFAYMSAQEGNVFKQLKKEIKGVSLRSSNVPPYIISKANEMMTKIMDTVMQGEKISLVEILKEIYLLEAGIKEDIYRGSYSLLTRTSIKNSISYKKPESSNYLHYDLWESVFSPKYGHTPEPPYVAIKVSLMANNPTRLKNWIASMEDRVLADRFTDWLAKKGKKDMTMILLPESILSMSGVPKEIIQGINLRELIMQIMESFYLILESLGYFIKNDNNTKLISDMDWLELEQM